MKALVAKSRGTSKYLGGGAKGTTKISGKHSSRRDSNWGNSIRHVHSVRATSKCLVVSAYAALPFNGGLVRFEPNLDLTNFRTSSNSHYQSSVEHFGWFPSCNVMTMKSDVVRRSKPHLPLRSTCTIRYNPRDLYYVISTIVKQWRMQGSSCNCNCLYSRARIGQMSQFIRGLYRKIMILEW